MREGGTEKSGKRKEQWKVGKSVTNRKVYTSIEN